MYQERHPVAIEKPSPSVGVSGRSRKLPLEKSRTRGAVLRQSASEGGGEGGLFDLHCSAGTLIAAPFVLTHTPPRGVSSPENSAGTIVRESLKPLILQAFSQVIILPKVDLSKLVRPVGGERWTACQTHAPRISVARRFLKAKTAFLEPTQNSHHRCELFPVAGDSTLAHIETRLIASACRTRRARPPATQR